MEDSVTVLLKHPSMRVKARIAEFSDLFGQKLNPVGRVAENDRLIDLKFGEESVQAMNLLLLLDESIVLSDTT